MHYLRVELFEPTRLSLTTCNVFQLPIQSPLSAPSTFADVAKAVEGVAEISEEIVELLKVQALLMWHGKITD